MRHFGDSQCRLDLARTTVTAEHVIHRQAIQGIGLLAHMRDTSVGGQQVVISILAELAAQQREQAGLTSAISPGETGPLAGMQGQFSSSQEALQSALWRKIEKSGHGGRAYQFRPYGARDCMTGNVWRLAVGAYAQPGVETTYPVLQE